MRATTFVPAKRKSKHASPRVGERTSCSPCFRSHRRPWRNCANARRHSRTQASADAGADVKHEWRRRQTCGGDSMRGRPTDGGDAPLIAHDDLHRGAKQNSTRFATMGGLTCSSPCSIGHRRPWRNCARARRHGGTQADADDCAAVKHAWRQQREGPAHRRRRTHILSARDDIQLGAKQKSTRFVANGGTHELLAMFPLPPPTVAELRPRTQAFTHTGRHGYRRRRQTRAVATSNTRWRQCAGPTYRRWRCAPNCPRRPSPRRNC